MISKDNIEEGGNYDTKLYDDQFIHFVDNSSMGILIIQRGYIKYFNQKFLEIFGYTKEEVQKWEKREFQKIIHPEDLPKILKKLKVEDDKRTITARYRGITKNNQLIDILNYTCKIEYNNKTAYLASYVKESPEIDTEFIPKTIVINTKKKIFLEYNPEVVKILKDNNLKFCVIKNYSYREED
ncbi:MAG: PAS domain-containing protein [Promethearchaeota archaeon]